MLKVYFVDDEELLLRELVGIIDWAEEGFEICGCNTDPAAAKEEILRLAEERARTDAALRTKSDMVQL